MRLKYVKNLLTLTQINANNSVNMSSAYWSQYSHSEIISMHGVELDQVQEDDIECDCDDNENKQETDCCPRCYGGGCNYCLMLDW